MPLPTVAEIELAGLRAWPALDTVEDGKWVMRAAGGYSKRANSVQSLDPADDTDVTARLERAVRWYRDRRLPPIFRVTPLAGPATLAALEGWTRFEESRVMAMDLGDGAFEGDRNVAYIQVDSPEWLSVQQTLQGYSDDTRERLRHIVSRIKAPARGLVLWGEDVRPAAAGYVTVSSGIAFIGNIIAAEHQRRKGNARKLVSSGLAWARRSGARRSALQVLAVNAPAIALYESLGYSVYYDYHHRRLDT